MCELFGFQGFHKEQKQEQRIRWACWHDQVLQGSFLLLLEPKLFSRLFPKCKKIAFVSALVCLEPMYLSFTNFFFQTPLTESLIEFTDPVMNRVAADLFLCKLSPSPPYLLHLCFYLLYNVNSWMLQLVCMSQSSGISMRIQPSRTTLGFENIHFKTDQTDSGHDGVTDVVCVCMCAQCWCVSWVTLH